MNDEFDPLEAELAAFRPHAASRELRQRLADLRTGSPLLRWRWGLALAGSLAAACVAAAIFHSWGGGQDAEPPRVIRSQPAPAPEARNSEPTLLAYRLALARSPEGLDALLNEQALAASETNPQFVRACAFTRSNGELHDLLGDD